MRDAGVIVGGGERGQRGANQQEAISPPHINRAHTSSQIKRSVSLRLLEVDVRVRAGTSNTCPSPPSSPHEAPCEWEIWKVNIISRPSAAERILQYSECICMLTARKRIQSLHGSGASSAQAWITNAGTRTYTATQNTQRQTLELPSCGCMPLPTSVVSTWNILFSRLMRSPWPWNQISSIKNVNQFSKSREIVFKSPKKRICEATVTLTFVLWVPKSNQFICESNRSQWPWPPTSNQVILESKWMFIPKVMKFSYPFSRTQGHRDLDLRPPKSKNHQIFK